MFRKAEHILNGNRLGRVQMARKLLASMTAEELSAERDKLANASSKAARIRFMDIFNEELRREQVSA